MASPCKLTSLELSVAPDAVPPASACAAPESTVVPVLPAQETREVANSGRETATALAPSFADVFDRFGDYVPALLRRLGVATAEIPDVSQEVFTVVHEKLASFRGDSSLKTWICGISLRLASNHRRRAWVRRVTFLGDLDQRVVAAERFDRLELQERVLALEAALTRLPAKQREVFVLFEVEELSMAEIARVLACPEKTAYTRLYAARRAMARMLAGRGSAGRYK